MLLERHATVTICHSRTARSGGRGGARRRRWSRRIGRPQTIRGDWIRPGAVVIDVGINRIAEAAWSATSSSPPRASAPRFITPVPGGVGPMTVAMLMQNTLTAARRRQAARADALVTSTTHAALRRAPRRWARASSTSPAGRCRCSTPASSRSTTRCARAPACSTSATWARSRCAARGALALCQLVDDQRRAQALRDGRAQYTLLVHRRRRHDRRHHRLSPG